MEARLDQVRTTILAGLEEDILDYCMAILEEDPEQDAAALAETVGEFLQSAAFCDDDAAAASICADIAAILSPAGVIAASAASAFALSLEPSAARTVAAYVADDDEDKADLGDSVLAAAAAAAAPPANGMAALSTEEGATSAAVSATAAAAAAAAAAASARKQKKKKTKKASSGTGASAKEKAQRVATADALADGDDGEGEEWELPVEAITLPQKGAPRYVLIKEQPCLLTSARLKKKATNKGNDRMEMKGTHMWTGKKYEDTVRGDTLVQVPRVTHCEYSLLDVDGRDGTVRRGGREGRERARESKRQREWENAMTTQTPIKAPDERTDCRVTCHPHHLSSHPHCPTFTHYRFAPHISQRISQGVSPRRCDRLYEGRRQPPGGGGRGGRG